MKTIVGKMVASWQQDLQWDENLDLYEYALNVSYHPAVQNIPYVLWFSALRRRWSNSKIARITALEPTSGPTAVRTPSTR